MPILMMAQNKNIEINWKSDTEKNSKSKKATFSKDKSISAFQLETTDDELIYREQWVDKGFADEKSLKVANVIYGDLTNKELKNLNKNLVPDQLNYTIKSNSAREVVYTVLSITPVVKSNFGYKKVLSFTISYTNKSRNRSSRNLQITNSVLANGNWYKFKVEKTGIHRISQSFLNDLGMNTETINPRNIKIYGNGGAPLPFLNEENTVFDLPENAIQVVGEADGEFSSSDYILFYAESTLGYHGVDYDTNINPYSDDAYYYITVGSDLGLRVQEMIEPSGSPLQIITQFNDYQFIESDEESPVKVGRRWFSNRFDIESEQSFVLNFPNIISGEPMDVKVKVASASESITSMAVSINGTSLDPLIFSPINDPTLLDTEQFVGEVPAGDETVTFDIIYNNGGNPTSIGYLDYISVDAIRQLSGVSGQLAFRNNSVGTFSGIGEYRIDNASQFSQVWDVTNPAFITSKQNEGNNSSFVFKSQLGEVREYVAVNPSDYFLPIKASQSAVPNQNLKGTIFNNVSGDFEDVDYLIVVPPFLVQPALRLANHRKNIDGINVKVVTTDKIYQEFSSGKQDIGAIRNFVRYIYENASSDDNRIKYVCLFGDTSVDYKDRLSNNNNIVPTFHTLHSRSTYTSFMSDDFFGNMDLNEGLMVASEKLDIAVGRMVVDEVSLANAMIDKIVNYESKVSYGNWRNDFVLVSDDVDKVWEHATLQVNLDALGDEVSLEKPYVNVKKIHSDSYQQIASAGGDRYPDVNDAFEKATEVGALIINYFGHGGEDGLASERIFTKETANDLKNNNRFPCIVTVTCEFSKFDNPLRITAGELTFWNKEGGAISLISTTRSISAAVGVLFNQELAPEIFGYGKNIPNPPAEAVRISKNNISSPNRRVVFFIGDPAMHLAFPQQKIKLTTLNGVPITQAVDTLKALSKVRIGGEIQDENNVLLTSYNGVLEAKLFDKNSERSTLGNDGTSSGGELLILDYLTLGEVLFNGQAKVTNGLFEFEFVMPKDTKIPVDTGRLSFYAQGDNALDDRSGFNLELKIGGLNEDAPEDNQGPLIQLFMNDESFVSGGITNDSPILIAKLEDENGINTASGIGHDIIAILDGDESNPFVLNEYYQAEVDDYTMGLTNYKLRDLENGIHTLTIKAWDVYNNSSTADIQFVVANNESLEITRVLNYPNPFVSYTEFWFNHNREFETLEVQVQVFTITGKVVWTSGGTFPPNGSNLFRSISWDGKDDFGDRIGKGVYVYKITVKSTLTNHQVEKFEKLVIL